MRSSRGATAAASADVFASRLKRLRALLRSGGHEAMLVTAEADVRYLTGFSGEASCLIVAPRKLVCISDSRFEEELVPLASMASVIIRKGSMLEAQRDALAALGVRSLALQSEAMTVQTRVALGKALASIKLGARAMRDTAGIIAELRMIKDDAEVRAISAAAKIQQEALLAVLPGVKVGHTEAQIAAKLEYECRVRGSEAMAFGTIVAAGANSSKPHYRAGPAKVARRKALLIDWGCTVRGYRSDMTRTFHVGPWSRAMREIYEIVLEAHLAGIDAVRPGATCHDVDAAARSIIERAGYGDRFGHGTGHGIGLDIHEPPRLFRNVARPLEPGMVVTVEPGIYLPGVGGVRIEDDILVTPRGGRNLCSLPKDLHWATLNG